MGKWVPLYSIWYVKCSVQSHIRDEEVSTQGPEQGQQGHKMASEFLDIVWCYGNDVATVAWHCFSLADDNRVSTLYTAETR